MIEFGKTLRNAREARNYSVSQLAEITHILPQIIENLENEDFAKIVAPIYGRGFVKLYCETVGLDPKPLVDEFMEIYNGNRRPTIRLKDVEEEPAATQATEPEEIRPQSLPPEAAEPPETSEPPLFDFAASAEPASERHVAVEPAPEQASQTPADDRQPVRRDYRLPGHSMPEVPRSFWRFGILTLVAAVIVFFIVLGTRALYRATMRVPKEDPATQAEATKDTESEWPVSHPEKPAAPRKGVPIPPLYID